MKHYPCQRLLKGLTLAAMLIPPAAFTSADFPVRPVRIVVPNPPGGTVDLIPRLLAQRLSQKWNQPVVVENRTGAAGNIGAAAVARADPDGYTLLVAPPTALAINQSIYSDLQYDANQFESISILASVPNLLMVNPKVPVNTVQELIDYAKKHPGKLSYASQGNGSTTHLAGELFKTMAGVDITHIPYRGSAPAMADVISGQTDVLFDNLGAVVQYIDSGRLRALGIADTKSASSLPQVAPISQVLPGYSSVTWFGMVAPPGTPKSIVDKISHDINQTLQEPEIIEKLRAMNSEPVGMDAAQTAAFLKTEREKWAEVVQQARIPKQ